MTNFLKLVTSAFLAIALIGCKSDSPENNQQTAQQQPQQPGQMGQMQQPVPDVDLSDEEAGKFADAAMSAQQIQMKAQKQMIGIIRDEGLDIRTFQQIAQSSRSGQIPDSISASDKQAYQSANDSIQTLQGQIKKDISLAVQDAGMEMNRFRTISRAAQQDTQLQRQIRQKMQEKMKSQMQMPQQQQGGSSNN